MWPRTDLLDLLGISHPIIQAPISGYTGPALAAAVANAGGLGSLGCAALSTRVVREQVEEVRRATNRPINLNFFVHPAPRIDADVARRMRRQLSRYYAEFGFGAVPEPSDPLPASMKSGFGWCSTWGCASSASISDCLQSIR